MSKLLNTLICILLTSPLSAFDISLEGVEFGSLQMSITDSSWSGGAEYLSGPLTLNNGDVLQVLRLSIGSSGFNYSSENSSGNTYEAHNYIGALCTQGDISSMVSESDFVVGPSSIVVGYSFKTTAYPGGGSVFETLYPRNGENYYVQMDYAILRAGVSTQSSYVTIPVNPSGNFEVKLQTSSDLQTWSPTTPGIFPYGDNAKFFRLVVE